MKSYDESINILEYLNKLIVSDEVLLLAARVSLLLGDYENGMNYYELSLDRDIFNYENYTNEIIFFGEMKWKYVSQDYLKFYRYSIDLCDLLLEKYDDVDTKLWKSYMFYLLNDYEESLKLSDNIFPLISDNLLVYFLKAENLLKLKRYEESVKFSEKGLDLDSSNILLIQTKAKVLYFLKEYEESLYCFNKVNGIGENDEAYLFIAKVNMACDDWHKALWNIDKSICGWEEFYDNLKKEYSEIYYRANYFDLFWHKSLILFKLERFDDANDIIDCLIEKEESAKNYCLKAKILYEMGDYENALMFVNKALDLKPDCRDAIQLKENLINSS